ncbi:MAG TPA: DUF234 domain-containing protein [Gemmatirosa sp.]
MAQARREAVDEPMPRVVDREAERRELVALASAPGPRLALLTGRRRVGKTYLLAHAWAPRRVFLFTAARTTPEVNRSQLVADLAAWSGEPLASEDYPTWRAVFRLVFELTPAADADTASSDDSGSAIVVIDEFQYLADGEAGVAAVASELNAVYEAAQRGRVGQLHRSRLVVLAGSAVSTMEALAGGGAPLYGRFAWAHRLRPFDYWHAAELALGARAPAAAAGARDRAAHGRDLRGRDLRERALVYGIFGGTPRYLAAVDPTQSVAANATRVLLHPRGEVRQLVETALEQEDGLRDVPKYRAILYAVAVGQTERNAIAQRTGLPNDQALRDKLERLVALGYLDTRQNVDAKPNAPVRYAVADPALRFYHRFVAPHASVLERYPAEDVWASSVAPHLDAYMGHAFERVAAEAYDRQRATLDLPMIAVWGRWEGTDRARRSLEVDLVAPLTDGRVLTGAVKWDRAPITAEVHRLHLGMLERAADAGRAWAHLALAPESPLLYVAAGGFARGFRAAAEASGHPVLTWALADLYRTGSA